MKKALLLTTIGTLFCMVLLHAQNVFDPADPLLAWNSGATLGTSTNPNPDIQGLQKWVRVPATGVSIGSGSYDVSGFKAYYVNIGGAKMCFRLKFPKSYSNPDSAAKKYAVMVFFHGAGEPGCPSNGGIYNNERQLVHGGRFWRDNTDNGNFDGFLFYPQVLAGTNCWSDWGVAPYSPYYALVLNTLDSLVKYVRVDNDKVFANGLSNGGGAAWNLMAVYPTRVAKIAPSAAATDKTNYSDFVHIPMWFATGGKDTNPSVGYASTTYNNIKSQGADIRWTLYPDLGHAVWDQHWAEPDYIPYMNDIHKANPLVFFQRSEFCPDSAVNSKIGISPGFYAYEWQKDGVTIATRTGTVNTVIDGSSIISYTGNEITVNAYGTYRVRFKRTASGDWSLWSPKPAVIKVKSVTQTPNIMVSGTRSTVLPAPDGSQTVPLVLPDGYFSYQWFRNDTLLSTTTRNIDATVGNYRARVVEQFGCGTLPSPIFSVLPASGNPKPDPAKSLTAIAASLTSIQLDWTRNPNGGQPETGFEVYRGNLTGGPYQLLTILPPGTVSYLDQGLASNKQYFYIVRAVSAYGAAANSNEATATTAVDNVPPTAPPNFRVLSTASNYAYVAWDAATDNVGVDKYDVYVNGTKAYSTNQLNVTVANLDSNQVYTFYVKARDKAGNVSAPSNQVTASTAFAATGNGINYKYYEGAWSVLPDFSTLPIIKTGFTSIPDLSVRNRSDNIGFLWEGYIKVPTSANYTFEVCSDDGTKLYVGKPYGYTELVNNDGLHGTICKSGTIYLSQGVHPLAIAYFNATGGSSISLNWQNDAGLSKTAVPASAYYRKYEINTGTAPNPPSNLVATATGFNKIQLTWVSNSANASGYELVRSTSYTGSYVPIATVTGTSYLDSGLTANTKYYYKVRAVGPTGESAYSSNYTEANWQLNGSPVEASGNSTRDLTINNGTYNTTDKKDGSASLSLSGSNSYATVNNSSTGGFPSDGGYTQRTVAMWIKPSAISNKKVIFDFGNNTNGLGLRFNGTSLQAGVASNGTRVSISLSNVASNANWSSGNWNHVAVVYNQSSLKLFLNGVEVASNNALGFTSIAAAVSNASRFGFASGTTAVETVFNDTYTTGTDNYSGLIDAIYVINGAMNAGEITGLKNFTYAPSWDITQQAPVPPAAPSGLGATLLPGNSIRLNWTDNSTNETGFEVWRSLNNNTNYRLIATLPAGAITITDSSLFANVTYYYKVRAKGVGGYSGYTNEVNVTTVNSRPVLQRIKDFTMKAGTTFVLPLMAVDPDGDALTFSTKKLPYFGTLQNVSNGNANLVFNTSIYDQGAFTITVYVTDGFNGNDTIKFTMVVNDNPLPVVNPVNNVTINEGATPLRIPLVANDPESNSTITWWANRLPSFATLVDSGNGRASITLAPGYLAAGNYQITVGVDDGYGGQDSKTFNIVVNHVDPNEKFQLSFMFYTGGTPLWNDIDAKVANFNVGNLINTKNQVTTAGINVVSGTYDSGNGGAQTGNNSGVYPDRVMLDFMRWGGPTAIDTVRLRAYGLNPQKKYNFVFFSSNTCSWCGFNANTVTTFKIGNATASVKYYNNTSKTDTIYQVQPDTNGQVFITCIGDPDPNVGGVLNALVMDAQFDDGSVPAQPLNLAAQAIQNQGVRLTWVDKAFNETAYRVYRATNRSGPYTTLNPTATNADSTGYNDQNVAPFTQYYYYIQAVNSHGSSLASDTVKVLTGNNLPTISGLQNIIVKTGASAQEDFTVTDDPGDIITVTIPNMPSFVSLQSLGGGSYRIIASPSVDNIGWSSLTVQVSDDKGGSVAQTITLGVTDKNTRTAFLTFGDYSKVVPSPWNTLLGYGNAGSLRSNLLDQNGVATTFSVQLIEGWTSIDLMGHMTGNNTGVYPDAVLQTGILDNNATTHNVKFTGLDPTKRYNLVFVGSHNEGVDASCRYTTGTVTATLNARNNTNQTANLNGLTPNAAGEITVTMTRLSGATYTVLTALQIEEYTPATPPLNPMNLYVEPKDRNSVSLSWSDRTSNEDAVGGMQLQRASDSLFTLNVQTFNLAANTTVYTNTGLTPNTKYWYRVRAKVSGVFTDYSNRVKTITPQNTVYLNFNFSTPNAVFPWNNTSAPPNIEGVQFTDLYNQAGNPSGLTATIERAFNGENVAGVVTGNNSGIVPDAVLQSCYWLDNTQLSTMRITGLNESKRYRFGFIGSMGNVGWYYGNYTATYTINGRTVYLNSWMNSTKIVYIGDVVPDSNGEVVVQFSTTAAAAWGFNSGMIIQTYDDVNGGTVPNIVTPGSGNNPSVETVNVTTLDPVADAANNADKNKQVTIRAYPNPFNNFVNLDFNNTAASNLVSVDIYDLGGRLMYRQAYPNLPAGFNTLRLNTAEGNLGKGLYMITLRVNGKVVHTAKMLRAGH